MGLMIHSLEEFPSEATRGYYIYVLDYGWDEPLSNALMPYMSEKLSQDHFLCPLRGRPTGQLKSFKINLRP